MNYTIKNAKPSCVGLAATLQEFNAFGTAADGLLAQVDIIAAINYYGITELLDTIGEENLRLHLKLLETAGDKPI